MKVILGPEAGTSSNYGSATSKNSIPGLMKPLHARDPGKWVAGHLLNDNLGGHGTLRKNLTPLTKKANRRHATYEGKIKNECVRARQFHNDKKNDGVDYWICVRYGVDVSSTSFKNEPGYRGAPHHIKVKAEVVHVKKGTRRVIKVVRPICSVTIKNIL